MVLSSYLPLLPIAVLILNAGIILGLRIFRPRFSYSWLIAVLGTLIAWPVVLFTRNGMPHVVRLFSWTPAELFPVSSSLVVDQISWPYALALVTIVLAILLTDVVRSAEADWVATVSILLQAALGLFAVQSGNLLTLLLSWTAIDLVEVLILVGLIPSSIGRERVIVMFSARLAGSIVLIGTMIYASSLSLVGDFASLLPQVSPYLVLAAGLRLGALTLRRPILRETQMKRNLGSLSWLIAAAVSLILLTRTSDLGVAGISADLFTTIAGLIGLFAAISWLIADNEIEGRPYWILCIGALAVAATIRGQPMSTLALSMAGLLPGALLFLASARQRYLTIILILGMFGVSGLPFSPSWQAASLYAPPFDPWQLVFLLIQIILLGGYARHALRVEPVPAGKERWVWVIYPWGLALLVLAHFLIGWFIRPAAFQLANILPGIIICAGLGFLVVARRKIKVGSILTGIAGRLWYALQAFFSMEWFLRIIWRSYNIIGQLVSFITVIIEGDGGVLWALLVLVLLVAFLAQAGLGI